jgi:nitrite reductase (NADH) large subunit
VCKPTVASILASLNNEMILDGHATLQDTNDRALGNMQRGECTAHINAYNTFH